MSQIIEITITIHLLLAGSAQSLSKLPFYLSKLCSLYASIWVDKTQLGVFQITLLFASNGRAEQVVSTLRKHMLASGLLNLSSEYFQRTVSLLQMVSQIKLCTL